MEGGRVRMRDLRREEDVGERGIEGGGGGTDGGRVAGTG